MARTKLESERALRDFLAEHSLVPVGKTAWTMFQKLRAEMIARDSDIVRASPPYRQGTETS
jgi:hypothetical protein